MVIRRGRVYTDLNEPFDVAGDAYTPPDWLIDQSRAASTVVEPVERIELPMINISAEEPPEEPRQSIEPPPGEQSIEEPEARRLRLEEVGRKQRERGKEWVKDRFNKLQRIGLHTASADNPTDTSYPVGTREQFLNNFRDFAAAYNKKARGGTLTAREERNRNVKGNAIGQLMERTTDQFFGGTFPSFNSKRTGFNEAAVNQIYDTLHPPGKGNMHDLKNQSVLLDEGQNEDFQDGLDSITEGFKHIDAQGLANSGVRLKLNLEELAKLERSYPAPGWEESSQSHAIGKGTDVNIIWAAEEVPEALRISNRDEDKNRWRTSHFRQHFGYKGDPRDIGRWAKAIIKMHQTAIEKDKNFMAVNESIGYPGKPLGKNHLHGNMVSDERAIEQSRTIVRWGKGNRFASLGVHPEIYLNTITESDLPVLAWLANTYPDVMEKLRNYLFDAGNWESKDYYTDRKKRKTTVGTVNGAELYDRFINRKFQVLDKGKWVNTRETIREKIIQLIPELVPRVGEASLEVRPKPLTAMEKAEKYQEQQRSRYAQE